MMNNTTEAQSTFQVSLGAKICLYVAFIAIFLLGIIGNSAVIYLIGIRQKATKTYDIQILSLSTTDLLASFFVPIVNIHDLVTSYASWELFGNIGCKIFLSSNHLTIVVSALMLVLISLTRFKVITASKAFHSTRRKTIIEIIIVWTIAFAVVSPYIHVSHINNDVCDAHWKKNSDKLIYFCILEGVSCVIPIFIMTVVYTISSQKLQKRKVPSDDKHLSQKRKRQTHKITSMFRTIVVIFFLLTAPYMTCIFMTSWCLSYKLCKDNREVLNYISYISYTLASFNSTVNPFIYARMHRGLNRRARKRLSHWKNKTLKRARASTTRTSGYRETVKSREPIETNNNYPKNTAEMI